MLIETQRAAEAESWLRRAFEYSEGSERYLECSYNYALLLWANEKQEDAAQVWLNYKSQPTANGGLSGELGTIPEIAEDVLHIFVADVLTGCAGAML